MISPDWEVIVKVNDTHVSFKPWDTASHQDYDTVRPLSYPETVSTKIFFFSNYVLLLIENIKLNVVIRPARMTLLLNMFFHLFFNRF